MSDLISRSDVLDLLYGIFDKYKMSTDKNTSIGKSFGTDVFEEIRNMPTSYDIDKVVEKLEEIRAKKTCNKEKCDTKDLCRICVVDDAIEIVKQGGVSDDFCEWTQSGDMAISPHTFSKYKIKQCDGLYALSTCPYCGKKIKVVE